MNLFKEVLDNQLVDRNQERMGRVDGIVVELRENQPPRLAYLEVGLPVLAQRIHPRLASLISAIQSKWGPKHKEGFRIPWAKINNVGIDVEVDLDAEDTPALDYEKWVKNNVVKKLGG